MWVLAATTWVAVVIAGSLLTWLAIDRAGQQVTGSAAATQAPVVGTVGPPPVSSPPPATGPSRSAGSSSGPAAGGAATTRPSPTPGAPTPGQTPSALTTTKRPGTSTTQAPAPGPRTEIRTWSGTPGFVTVSCTGALAVRKGASPSDGWSFEAGDASGDSVEVTFRNGGTEVQVHATCVGGVPRFSVESDGGGADDH
jgi:hypothetical protein